MQTTWTRVWIAAVLGMLGASVAVYTQQPPSLMFGNVTSIAPTYTNGTTNIASLDTAGNLRVVVSNSIGGTADIDDSSFAISSDNYTPVGGIFDDVSSDTIAENSGGSARITTNRAIHVNPRDGAGTQLFGTAAALADDTSNPTLGAFASYLMCFDGTTWDRCRSASSLEDAGHTSGDAGTEVLAVRRNAAASSTATDIEYATLNTDALGLLWSRTLDPCSGIAPTTVAVSLTADTVVISASASNRNYICGGTLVAGAAEIVSIWEGTGSTCGTSSAAVAGSTTEANGMSFAANGGFNITNTIRGIGTNVDTCIRVSGSNRVSGFITYVQAP